MTLIDFKSFKEKTQSSKRDKQPGLHYLGYLIHRDISVYISYALIKFFPTIKPNTVSILMILLGVLGGILLWSDQLHIQGAGLLVIYVSFILDKVDGEIARYKNMHSNRGMYLDEWYHVLVPQLVMVSFFLSFAFNHSIGAVLLLISLIFLSLMNRFDRKFCYVMAVKGVVSNKGGNMLPPLRSSLIQYLGNLFFLRIGNLIERFDIFLLACGLMYGILFFLGYDLTGHLLIIYVTLSMINVFRWFFLRYAGGIDDEVSRVTKSLE